MNGFITKNTLRLCLSGVCLVSLIGCYHYRELVDPCWPERYNYIARHGVRDPFYAQADKGHLLEQTIWNWHFETDSKGLATDHLNGAGMAVLSRIARTLPAPDLQLFVQNAQDVPYVNGMAPEKIVAQRDQLNKRRIDAILRYMSTQQPAGGNGAFQVAVHDFAPTSLPGLWPVLTEFKVEQNMKNGMPQIFMPPTYTTK
jgi:hypothetical protein